MVEPKVGQLTSNAMPPSTYIVKYNKRYTLALTLVRRSDSALDVLKRLVDRAEEVGLRIKRLYLDRGFDNNAVIAYLKDQPYPAIIPLTIRGKKGGSRQLLTGRKSYVTTYTRPSVSYGEQTFTVQVVCKYNKGRYHRNDVKHFDYIIIGKLKLTPKQTSLRGVPVPLCYRDQLSLDEHYARPNDIDLCGSALLLCRPGIAVAQSVELRQMASVVCPQAWPASTPSQVIAIISLASVALGSDQRASGFFVGNLYTNVMIAVY